MVGHIEYDKRVGEDSLTLHGQSLHSSPWISGQDEAFLLLLDTLDFLLDHLGYNLVLDYGKMLEVGLDFLTKFLLFRDFFLEQVAHRDGRKLIMVCDLKGKLSYFEPRWSNDEDLLRWVRYLVLCGVDNLSMRKEMGSSGCRMMRCFSSSSKRS